jgi:hypothetical protein
MKMSAHIDQHPYAERLATLTQLYLELSLPLENALRAAEADPCHIYRPTRLVMANRGNLLGRRGPPLGQKMAALQAAIPDWKVADETRKVPLGISER